MIEGVPDADELIPPVLADLLSGRPADQALGPAAIDGAAWLAALPGLVDRRLTDWDLTVTGAPLHGQCALVLPVRRTGEALMLKLTWPHHEAAAEHLALRRWSGRGAVRLVAAQPSDCALLLEALDPAVDLSSVYIDEACETIGELLPELHVPAPPTIPLLTTVVGRWLEPLRAHPPSLPRRAVDRALEVFDAADTSAAVLLHGDLHYANVLAADREPWLAIDPKPLAGPAAFELYPALRNRADEYGTGSALRWQVRRRVEVLCECAGIDWDQAREWSIVRAVLDAYWSAQARDRAQVTLALAIAQVLDD